LPSVSCTYNHFYFMDTFQDEFFGKWVGHAHIRLFHLLTRKLQKEGFDLTFEQVIMLKVINVNEGITQQEVATMISKDKTSVTRAISVLEDHHKVVRITAKGDKRKKGLFLTKEGKEFLKLAIPQIENIRTEFEKVFTKQEMNQNIDFLKRVINITKELEEKL